MKFKIYSVFDSVAKAYLPPFVVSVEAQAVRACYDAVCDKGHAFGKHPGDYSLFDLGVFDDATGVIESLTVPVLVVSFVNLVPTIGGVK